MEPLSEDNLLADPIRQFAQWYAAVKACSEIKNPDAMCLATVCSDGYPEGRMVLLKEFNDRGFVFYSNTLSAKGRALAFAPRAELVFYWPPLARQVRVQGDVQPLRNEESDAYFATRPRASQLAAWASLQSDAADGRDEIERRLIAAEQQYLERAVPRPPQWGGYRVAPLRIEFWQEREDRLHDRFRYLRQLDGTWKSARLFP
ncbi:MAG: pyridoxamine 5'-phosphate oxidase [Elusimicrobiota bacterium]